MLGSSDPNLEITEVEEIVVVRLLHTKVFNDQKTEDIIHELRHLTSKLGKRTLRIDLELVKYLQSSALGKLVSLQARVKATGGRVTLANVHPTVARVLAATRLDQLLPIENVIEEPTDSE